MTGCTCKNPGFCERHQVEKGKHWHHLCQTSEKYFKLWEEGNGPGQKITKKVIGQFIVKPNDMGQPAKIKRELYTSHIGDILARRFESIGIKPIKGCPCKDLQGRLNTMSPAAVMSDLQGWATRLHNSAKKWQELKGGVWNLIPSPPVWLCKRVLEDAVREAKGQLGENELTKRDE